LYDTAIQLLADQWIPGVGVVFTKVNILFIVHHLVAFLYMTSTRLLRAGHMSAMILMFLGEATAPIMNLRRISNTATLLQSTSLLVDLHPWIEVVYAALYLFFRCLAGPVCTLHLMYDLLLTKEGRRNVPVPLSLFWITISWGIMIGSIPWIKTAVTILLGATRFNVAGEAGAALN
jgi:TLC domain